MGEHFSHKLFLCVGSRTTLLRVLAAHDVAVLGEGDADLTLTEMPTQSAHRGGKSQTHAHGEQTKERPARAEQLCAGEVSDSLFE